MTKLIAQRVFYDDMKIRALKATNSADAMKEMRKTVRNFAFSHNAKNRDIKIEFSNAIKKKKNAKSDDDDEKKNSVKNFDDENEFENSENTNDADFIMFDF